MSQTKAILQYMEEHGSITQQEAIAFCKCYRLSARIFDLRDAGYKILTVPQPIKGENGSSSSFAKYVLKG